MVNLRYFDQFIMIVICASSIALAAAEDPVREKSDLNEILNGFDFIFTGVFIIELVLKVLLYLVLIAILPHYSVTIVYKWMCLIVSYCNDL